jgi:hypothetical protein
MCTIVDGNGVVGCDWDWWGGGGGVYEGKDSSNLKGWVR